MKIFLSNSEQLYKLTYNPCASTPLEVLPLFLFVCCCSYLTRYTCCGPNVSKGKGYIFFFFPLSLLCLPYKCRNEHYIWNIFKGTLWWFTVLHLCKHSVFSPAGNQLPLLDLLSLLVSECSCFLSHRAETGTSESICFSLIYFLQSHITPGLILTGFCKQLLPLLGATADFFSLSEGNGFSLEDCTWFLK